MISGSLLSIFLMAKLLVLQIIFFQIQRNNFRLVSGPVKTVIRAVRWTEYR